MEEMLVPLTGTLPVIPVADRFYGTLYHDGQRPRVTALVYREPQEEQQYPSLLFFSLAASPTSGNAAMAQIADNRVVLFEPDPKMEWTGRPRAFSRHRNYSYKEIVKSLPNFVEQHFFMFAMSLHLEDLLLHPPELARDSSVLREREIPAISEQTDDAPDTSSEDVALPEELNRPLIMPDRYLLGNYDEATPNRHAFEGHLQALRLPFLSEWVDQLWAFGVSAGVITSLDALGVNAWIISGNIGLWTELISLSVTEGALRWN